MGERERKGNMKKMRRQFKGLGLEKYARGKSVKKRRKIVNKPAAQAAGADPSQCNSTNRPNPPFQ